MCVCKDVRKGLCKGMCVGVRVRVRVRVFVCVCVCVWYNISAVALLNPTCLIIDCTLIPREYLIQMQFKSYSLYYI